MKAVVFAGEGVAVEDVPGPTLGAADDAIVNVTLSAICGSDLHLLSGKTPGMEPGGIIGHEFTGVISATGSAVRGLAEGDRVLGSFLIACGTCDACTARRFNLCSSRRALGLGTLAGDLQGAQAEQVLVPHAAVNLKRLDDLDDEHALFGGDILATGFYAAARAEVADGETVAVIGGGPVGVFAALATGQRGAAVFVLDADPERVRFVRETLGLDALDVSDTEADEALRAATGGRLADVVMEAVGAPAALKSALRCVAEGGRLVIVGVYGAERFDLPMGRTWVRALDLMFAGMANVQAHWDEALAAAASGSIDPTAIVTHRLPLEEAAEGYRQFAEREAFKVILRP